MQTDDVDSNLATMVWNALSLGIWQPFFAAKHVFIGKSLDLDNFMRDAWTEFFRFPISGLKDYHPDNVSAMKSRLSYPLQWWALYDFVEFCVEHAPRGEHWKLSERLNRALEDGGSGYRIVQGSIAPITSEAEIAEIVRASDDSNPFAGSRIHIKAALGLLSQRPAADYRNAIKESISAVESAVKTIAGKGGGIKTALQALDKEGVLMHPALSGAFEKLYGYTSDADGIRHALLDEDSLDHEDALFFVVSCSAFVNYLVAKSAKANG